MNRKQQIQALLGDLTTVRHAIIAKKKQDGLLLSPSQRELLHHVYLSGEGISVSEIANLIGTSVSSVTQHLDELEERGYIKREQSPTDRRSVIVKVSHAGQKQIDKATEAIVAHLLDLFSELTDKEVSSFASILKKLANSTQSSK